MGVLTFLFTLRVKRIFDFKSHPVKTIFLLLFFITAVAYGYMFARLYNSPELQEKISPEQFAYYLILVLFSITFLRGFFPKYVPLHFLITNNYPISKIHKFQINLFNEFLYPFYIGITLFIVSFSFRINSGAKEFLLNAFVWIFTAHLLKRIVQFFVEYNFKELTKGLSLLTTLLAFIIYYLFSAEGSKVFIILILSILLLLLNYLLENNKNEYKWALYTNSKKYINVYSIKLFLHNKLLRPTYILAFLVKLIFVIVSWSLYKSKGHFFSESEIFIYLLISPLVLFSYFINNFFGFSRGMWLSISRTTTALYIYSKEMLKVLYIPLIIDSGLTLSFFIISNKLNLANISFYISSIIILFSIGVLNSFYFPKRIKSLFSMNGNTSILANIFSVLAVLILIVLTKYYFLANISASILGSFVLYYLTRNKVRNTHHKIFQKLFN